MIDLKPYYQVKLHLLIYKASFSSNPPKTEDEKYAYDIIQKAYWINGKKKEMLDFEKNKKLLYSYLDFLNIKWKTRCDCEYISSKRIAPS